MPSGIEIRMWGSIIQRGAREFGIVVTTVATGSASVVGVMDFKRAKAASAEEAQSRREDLIRTVELEASARGDRIVSLERCDWQLGIGS